MELHILAGLPIGLREMLEALLISILVIGLLKKEGLLKKRKLYIFSILLISFAVSILSAYGIFELLRFISTELKDEIKIIEALLALILAPILIYFLVHMSKMKRKEWQIRKNTKVLFKYSLVIFFAIFRESFEVSFIFFGRSIANNSESQLLEAYGILIGMAIAIVLVTLIHFGLLKIKLKWVLNFTIIYLVIQVAYIIGYAFHEISEYIVDSGISTDSIFLPTYNLRETILSKNDPLGIILNVLFGYYDKPEAIMLVVQLLTLTFLSSSMYILFKRKRIDKVLHFIKKPKLFFSFKRSKWYKYF